jgi:triosephosphate isomerase
MSNSTITPWVVGNWKMNPMHADAFQLIEEFKQLLQQDNISPEQCHIGVAPVRLRLTGVHAQLKDAIEQFILWLRIFLVWQVLVLIQVR